jgi:hypothetical protein
MSSQQLSKQDHYDFSLRSLTVDELVCSSTLLQMTSLVFFKAFLRYAGEKKRINSKMTDDEVNTDRFEPLS